MKRNKLRKVKWHIGTEYTYDGGVLTDRQVNLYNEIDFIEGAKKELISEIGESGYKSIKLNKIYETGYFHRWVVKYFGDLHEGIETYTQALVEDKKGNLKYFNLEDITFCNNDNKDNYNKLVNLFGKIILNDTFEELLQLIMCIENNKLIKENLNILVQAFENNNIPKALDLVDSLLDQCKDNKNEGEKEEKKVSKYC